MRRILIELDDAEWELLVVDARRERRTAQAQAGWLLVDTLRRRGHLDRINEHGYGALAEAQGGVRGAGEALPPGEQVGAVEGHGDGAAAGIY